jgi:hypothetical protein
MEISFWGKAMVAPGLHTVQAASTMLFLVAYYSSNNWRNNVRAAFMVQTSPTKVYEVCVSSIWVTRTCTGSLDSEIEDCSFYQFEC